MSDTIPRPSRDRHHLAPVQDLADDVKAVGEKLADITRLTVRYATAGPAGPALTRAAALRLDQAELFLLSLDTEMLNADAPRSAYLLGICENHLANMIELVRAVLP